MPPPYFTPGTHGEVSYKETDTRSMKNEKQKTEIVVVVQ
jgi:hypothetical protein